MAKKSARQKAAARPAATASVSTRRKKSAPAAKRKKTPPASASPVIKHDGSYLWTGVARQQYKDVASHWAGVSRTELLALPASAELPFHLRYFEIAAGGFSTREFHQHEHVVVVVRGQGTVDLAGTSHPLAVGDIVRVQSNQVHQFLHRGRREPFGFYCIVAADRDRPQVVGGHASACEWPGPTAKKKK
jgi:quercetin dioxygenase-like cupin family protein